MCALATVLCPLLFTYEGSGEGGKTWTVTQPTLEMLATMRVVTRRQDTRNVTHSNLTLFNPSTSLRFLIVWVSWYQLSCCLWSAPISNV